MISLRGSLRTAASAAFALAVPAALAAPARYHLVPVDIGAAYAGNAGGDLGGTGVPEEGVPLPVVVRAGTRAVLPCPDQGYGDVYGLNASGLAVGACATDTIVVNTMWGPDDVAIPVGTLGGDGGISFGVNDAGDVVGQAETTGNAASHAFLRHAGALQDLGTLGGRNSAARAINATGVVVGSSEVVPGNPRTHAFVWAKGRMTDLGTFGGPGSQALAVNSRGHVAGSAEFRGKGHPARAFLWDGRRKVMLGTVGGDSVATGITDDDVVVGQSQKNVHFPPTGWVWADGRMTALDDISDARQQGYSVEHVAGVTPDGRIFGWMDMERDSFAFVLEPVTP